MKLLPMNVHRIARVHSRRERPSASVIQTFHATDQASRNWCRCKAGKGLLETDWRDDFRWLLDVDADTWKSTILADLGRMLEYLDKEEVLLWADLACEFQWSAVTFRKVARRLHWVACDSHHSQPCQLTNSARSLPFGREKPG